MQNPAMPAETQSPQISPVAVSFSEPMNAQLYHSPQLKQDYLGHSEQPGQALSSSGYDYMYPSPGLYLAFEPVVDSKTEPSVEAGEGIDPLDDTWENMINYPDDPGSQAWATQAG
jgi:hypothetical protein